jgi:outer membrane protein TolC
VDDIGPGFTVSRACLAAGFKDNPEILAANCQLEKSRSEETAAMGAHYPYLSFRGNYNFEDSTFFPGNPNWNVGASITVPIYHGGTDAAAVNEAEARTAQNMARLDDVRKDLAVRFESSAATIVDSLNRLATTAKVLALAEESFKTSCSGTSRGGFRRWN